MNYINNTVFFYTDFLYGVFSICINIVLCVTMYKIQNYIRIGSKTTAVAATEGVELIRINPGPGFKRTTINYYYYYYTVELRTTDVDGN